MNFYKHHIGDFAQATAHLSFVEDAAYSRLIRKYYAEEKPLPADPKAVQRLVGARTKEEKNAVVTALEEFFSLEDDGWHNKRCDEELTQWKAQAETNRRIAAEREAKKGKKSSNETETNRSPLDNESLNESFTSTEKKREPNQNPESRIQNPESNKNPIAAGVVLIPETAKQQQAIRTIGVWTPRPETIEYLTSPLNGIPHKFVLEQIGEFITYWRDRNLPAASWDSRFIKNAIRQWKSNGHTWTAEPGENHANANRTPRTPAEHRLDVSNATTDYDRATNF